VAQQTENRSARRSRRMIRQAFEELLQERGFHKITITDIVARADLNRSTFYAHYPDIYGIVDEMQDEIIQRNMELFRQLQFRNILKDPKPYLDCIAATMEQNLELMRRLGLSENLHLKTEKFQELMEYDIVHNSDIPEPVRQSVLFNIRVHFFLGGILHVYQRWAEGKLDCTLDQVSSQIGDMIRQTATGFLETNWTENL
jgi:AcrR family transcriptional regulator